MQVAGGATLGRGVELVERLEAPPVQYVDLRPWNTEQVQVTVAGQRWPGELLATRVEGERTLGWVRWSDGVGSNRLDWFDVDDLVR